MKKCSKCFEDKDEESFHKDNSLKSGRRSICNVCVLGHKPHKKPLIEKMCTQCLSIKNVGLFTCINNNKQWYSSSCKKCNSDRITLLRNSNPEKEKLRIRKKKLRSKYKLSFDTYELMISNQMNKCDICKVEMKEPCVDHNHTTNMVRGLLCSKCNSGIGMLQDNTEILKNAIIYLEKHKDN